MVDQYNLFIAPLQTGYSVHSLGTVLLLKLLLPVVCVAAVCCASSAGLIVCSLSNALPQLGNRLGVLVLPERDVNARVNDTKHLRSAGMTCKAAVGGISQTLSRSTWAMASSGTEWVHHHTVNMPPAIAHRLVMKCPNDFGWSAMVTRIEDRS
jgi:hypothetical protein